MRFDPEDRKHYERMRRYLLELSKMDDKDLWSHIGTWGSRETICVDEEHMDSVLGEEK